MLQKRVCAETELDLIMQSNNPADEFTRPSDKAEQYKIEDCWVSIIQKNLQGLQHHEISSKYQYRY